MTWQVPAAVYAASWLAINEALTSLSILGFSCSSPVATSCQETLALASFYGGVFLSSCYQQLQMHCKADIVVHKMSDSTKKIGITKLACSALHPQHNTAFCTCVCSTKTLQIDQDSPESTMYKQYHRQLAEPRILVMLHSNLVLWLRKDCWSYAQTVACMNRRAADCQCQVSAANFNGKLQ